MSTPEEEERIREIRRIVAHAGHDRRLRERGRHPGAAELRRRRGLRLGGLREPRVHLHPRHLDPDQRPRSGRLRAPGLPSRQPPGARGDHRLPRRPEAQDQLAVGVRGVQDPRQRLRDGGSRDAVPRARSPTPAAGRSAPPTIAAATAASAPRRRRTRDRSATGSRGSGSTRGTWCHATGTSTPSPTPSRRRASRCERGGVAGPHPERRPHDNQATTPDRWGTRPGS